MEQLLDACYCITRMQLLHDTLTYNVSPADSKRLPTSARGWVTCDKDEIRNVKVIVQVFKKLDLS